MMIVGGIVAILLGLLAASSLIASKSRGAGGLIEVIRPIQGWLGIVGCLWGLVSIAGFLFSTGTKLGQSSILGMVSTFGTSTALSATGFLMGFGMISAMLAKNASARHQADELYGTLTTFQVPLGVACIALGVLTVVRGL